MAVVNHRHGTPDWMPIQLKLRDDLEEAMASYRHYDAHIVNAMFDGMNLVAKEGPIVNERNGVSILSENTGAHEELGEFAPFTVMVSYAGAAEATTEDDGGAWYAYVEAKKAVDKRLLASDLPYQILGPTRLTDDAASGITVLDGARDADSETPRERR